VIKQSHLAGSFAAIAFKVGNLRAANVPDSIVKQLIF